jgi:hypothetical protein
VCGSRVNSESSAIHECQHRTAVEVEIQPWLIAVVVSLAAFMEFLDTSIANVALPHMAGDLGVTNDESTWVLTSYLASPTTSKWCRPRNRSPPPINR